MPDLTIQVQEIKGQAGTALVILNGSIDAKTVITFQTHLNSVKERGIEKFVLDMENVKYVNSTGLGYLINLSDSVGADRSGISLVRVQPKVKVVFDMLGLNAFFKIFNTREEAFKHLAGSGAPAVQDPTAVMKAVPAPAPPAPAAHTPAPRPPPAPVQPPSRPIAAPQSIGPVTPAPRPPSAALHTPPQGPPLAEPIHVECQACKALLAVKEMGTFKCPRCLTLFNHVGGGKVSFLPRQKALPVQLSLNFSAECTEGLLEFVKRLAGRAGFGAVGIGDVQGAVRETVETIRRHAYGGNDNNVYHVLLVCVDSELEMRFADYGSTLNSDKGELFASVRRAVDKFEVRSHPRGGNVLVLSKKAR